MPRRSLIRASDGERDAVAERLRHAAAEGRLLASELEQRLTVALRAQTVGELDALVADLPRVASGRPVARTGARSLAVRATALVVLLTAIVTIVGAVLLFVTGLAFLWVCAGILWMLVSRGRHRARPRALRYAPPRRGLL